MKKASSRKSEARQRIVETAERLFYAEGIRSVGVDRIIAEAQVAKMTLYNHFPSKDDLILAVLEYRETQFSQWLKRAMQRHAKQRASKLEQFFAALRDWFESPGFRGCSFINARIELADSEHPASRFSAAHKHRFRALLGEILAAEAGDEAVVQAVLPAISLLVEGAIVTAVMEPSSQSAEVAREAARVLLASARPGKPPRSLA